MTKRKAKTSKNRRNDEKRNRPFANPVECRACMKEFIRTASAQAFSETCRQSTVSDKDTDNVNQSRVAEDDDISNIPDTYRNMLEQNVDNSELKELQLKLEEKNKEVESLKLYINEFLKNVGR